MQFPIESDKSSSKTTQPELNDSNNSISGQRVQLMFLKSKREIAENNLLLFHEQVEAEAIAKMQSKLNSKIEEFVKLKYHFLHKNCELQDRVDKIREKKASELQKLNLLQKKETALIAKIERKMTKKGLKLLIIKNQENRFGNSFQIQILPEMTLPVKLANEKHIYYH